MDGLTLYKVANLLNKEFIATKVNKFNIIDDLFILDLYYKDKLSLCIKIEGSNSLIYLSNMVNNSENKKLKILNGSLIKNIETRSYDRLLKIFLEKRKPSGKLVKYTIIVEMVGRNSNLFVLNDENKIIFRLNKNNIDNDREISLGSLYVEFKLNKKWSLDNIGEANNFIDLIGFYSVTADYANRITKEKFDNFYHSTQYIKQLLIEDDCFYIDNKLRIIPFEIPNYNEKILLRDFKNLKFHKKQDENKRKNKLNKYFKKQLSKYKNLLDKLKIELDNALKYRIYFDEASLLKDNLHLILNNKGNIKLKKYLSDKIEEVEFCINSEINYETHINKLFKKANKLKISIVKIEKRINEVEFILQNIQDEIYYLDILSENEINELYLKIFVPKQKIKQKKEISFIKLQYKDAIYYVGKNSLQNHELVFKFALPTDIWFHAQKTPSAHLLLRKNSEVTEKEIEIGAKIVAYFSKHSNENRVAVDYTFKKYVKKPKNTPVGFVIYDNFKTIIIKPFSKDEIQLYLK